MTISFKLPLRPGNQFVHQPRRVKRSGRFKDDAHTSAVLIEGFHVVRNRLVAPAMVLVAKRKFEERSVKLLDVVFRQRHVPPGIEHQFRCLRIARNLLFIPRPE